MGSIRVFVSSPAYGLERERAAVKAVLERMRGTEFAGMELFGSRSENAQRASLEEVDEAQLYVGIIGGRYGSGITHDEYERARERNLDCLLYLQNDEAITVRDTDPSAMHAWQEWIDAITDSFDGHLVSHFSTPSELATMVAADVHSWLYRKLVREAKHAASVGAFTALRALIGQTRNVEDLRAALLADGVATGDDLLDGLLALAPATPATLLEGIRDLPTDYAARIENFLDAYVGTPDQPVPFGGRADVLAELDAWLAEDAAHPYLLLSAAAGRGKTAALVRWTRRRIGDPEVELIFVPVSIRFRTNLAGVFFPMLAARLARTHGDEVPSHLNLSAEVWRGVVANYLRKPLPDGRKLVVVLDGLDEAADWEAGPDLFPRRAPDNVRIIASARLTADLPTSESWLEQLGWDARSARTLPLRSLTRDGVRDVVIGMGCPLSNLAETTFGELYRLSQGDPLLVRLYVDELWARGDEVARLDANDLAAIDPGLEGYFERWWREQKKLWGSASPLKERGVRAVLDLLAAAFGPLPRKDILALIPPEAELNAWTLDDAIEPLRRFLVEGSAGLVFSHPRFGQYLASLLTASERRALDERFAAWSRTVRASMRSGELSPVNAPPYVVLHTGAHLERLAAGPDELCALLTAEWRTAWDAAEGGGGGFATDVSRAWRAARREDERLVNTGATPALLPAEVLCCLLQARIRSLAQTFPPVLMTRMVEEKLWRPHQASAYARNMTPSPQRVHALVEAARFADAEERELLLDEARTTMTHIEDVDERAESAVHLLRAGEPLDTFLKLESGEKVWVAAALALVETGRAAEVEKLERSIWGPDREKLIDEVLDHHALDDAATVCRGLGMWPYQHTETAFWRFALRGVNVFDESSENLVSRIFSLQQRAAKGLPLPLNVEDLRWITMLFELDLPTSDIAEFEDAVLVSLDENLRGSLRSVVEDPVVQARLGLVDPTQTLAQLAPEDLRRGELASVARGEAVHQGIQALEDEIMVFDSDLEGRARAYLRSDPAAFRAAVLSVPENSYNGNRMVAIAAIIDAERRPQYIEKLMGTLKKSGWHEKYDCVAPVLDRASLLRVAEIFARLRDHKDQAAARFIFASSPQEIPSSVFDWTSLDDMTTTVMMLLVLPDHRKAMISAALQRVKEFAPFWLVLVDRTAELLPPGPAAEIRHVLHRHIAEKNQAFLADIDLVLQLLHFPTVAACLAHLPPRSTDSKSKKIAHEIAAILQLPAAERQRAVQSLERHKLKRLVTPSLRHIAGELSDKTITRIVKRALEKPSKRKVSGTLRAIAPRISEAQAREIDQHARALPAKRRANLLAPILGQLPEPDRSDALAWMLSPEGIGYAVNELAETVLQRREILPLLIDALTIGLASDLPTFYRVAPLLLSLVVQEAMEIDAATARRLMLVTLDPHRDDPAKEAWHSIAMLRPLLVRSGDESLFPAITAAIDRATEIFP